MNLLRPGTRLRQQAVRARSLSSVAWTPAKLSGFVVALLPGLSRSNGGLWQNTTKTTAATADGDPVRVAVCPFTGLEWTATADSRRPLLFSEGGGKWSLSFDGVDDFLSMSPPAALTAIGTGGNAAVASAFRIPAAASTGRFVMGTLSGFSNPGVNMVYGLSGVAGNVTFRCANVACGGNSGGYNDATYRRYVGVRNSGSGQLYVNNSAAGSSAANTADGSASGNLEACSSVGGVSNLGGRTTGLVVAAAAWSAAERALLDAYLSATHS